MAPPAAVPPRDGPGKYRTLVGDTVVRFSEKLSSYEVGSLAAGTLVDVVEVTYFEAQSVVRARIVEPAGWITLLNTRSGYRRAARSSDGQPTPGPEEKREAVHGSHQLDGLLSDVCSERGEAHHLELHGLVGSLMEQLREDEARSSVALVRQLQLSQELEDTQRQLAEQQLRLRGHAADPAPPRKEIDGSPVGAKALSSLQESEEAPLSARAEWPLPPACAPLGEWPPRQPPTWRGRSVLEELGVDFDEGDWSRAPPGLEGEEYF